MPAGRKPLPTTIAELHGSPNHRNRANKREPVPPPLVDPVTASDAAPAGFTDGQRAEWEWTLANAPREMLRKIDRNLMASWCIAADIANQAGVELGAKGALVDHPTRGRIIASAWRVHKEATLTMIRLAEQMGFSPTARARIFRDGWEDRPVGATLVPPPADPKPGEAGPLSRFIAGSPARREALDGGRPAIKLVAPMRRF
jgi:phage terminase small subunit